ncbi:unnamed protein product [Arctogadus glacialis]
MTLKWSSSGAVQKLLSAIVRKRQWCEMFPCLEDEGCDLLVNRSGWTCTQPGGRVKTTTVLETLSLNIGQIGPVFSGPGGERLWNVVQRPGSTCLCVVLYSSGPFPPAQRCNHRQLADAAGLSRAEPEHRLISVAAR